ncbi:hypothetical protein RD792_012842 [Penstemon davidsonii]|uniref:Uncharacterized protein n=1 Tax=Penstemon davidsonii TaxID=160366 RepID=A0ABR0CY08_9LAMI|nr:hypothetical protein RD792_012842 [Penstemon davidsonii]
MDGKGHLKMNSSSSKSDEQIMRDEEIDNESESDNLDDSIKNRHQKRRCYHRHTPFQIQEMEAFFKECPHPDNKQRNELSRGLGMEPQQVKFWFQNKRTQLKTQHERQDNAILRAENEKLGAANAKYKEALNNPLCPACGGPTVIREMSLEEHQLRLENAKLKLEIDRISETASKYVGKPLTSSMTTHSTPCFSDITPSIFKNKVCGAIDSVNNIPQTNNADERPVVLELAIAAMDELIRMAQLGEPLWLPNTGCNSASLLNEDEYFRVFSRAFGPKQNGFKSEASRESVVIMSHANDLVEILMDVNQWSNVFSAVVSRVTNVQVILSGVGGNYDGALQMMNVEFQVPSPLVQTRESYFLRYCKEHMDGMWVVVDVSLEPTHTPMVRCRKRPSGCVIQKMQNGYLKVTWVEHVEVEDKGVNNIYKPLVNSGLAFGAKRWVAILQGQVNYIASANALTNNLNNIEAGRKSMLKLAQRMMKSFCFGVTASSANTWMNFSKNGADEVKIMTRKNMDDPSKPFGTHLSVATSFWLPVPPKRVFDSVLDAESDILFNGVEINEIAHIASSKKAGNRVSFYESSPQKTTILQESRTDPTGSYIVYAPIEMLAMKVVMGGGDPYQIPLLPSGFAILPDGPTGNQGITKSNEVDSGGTLLTVAFQVLVDSATNAEVSEGSIAAVKELITCTVDKIKKALINKS